MSDVAFMVASALVVAVGVAVRRLSPRDGSATAPEARAGRTIG